MCVMLPTHMIATCYGHVRAQVWNQSFVFPRVRSDFQLRVEVCVGVSLMHGQDSSNLSAAAAVPCKQCRSAATSPACLQLHDENMLMPDVFIGVAKTYLRQVSPTTFSQHPQGTTVAAHPGLSGNARVLQSGGSAQRQGISASWLDCVKSALHKGCALRYTDACTCWLCDQVLATHNKARCPPLIHL